MSQIILDMGSGNTCKNNVDYIAKMINAVVGIDAHKHEIIFKWQLFLNEHPNIPLTHEAFKFAYLYAKNFGYKTTSSVFDKPSLDFLLTFDIPFVKIACRPRTYWLMDEVPRRIPIYASYDPRDDQRTFGYRETWLYCIPEYPADTDDYKIGYSMAVSDHTIGLSLWHDRHPVIWEKHFILEDDPTNPDAAGHAIKPDFLKEVIGA